MRCKYIHYSVIPLMKTDKHFRRSETYFSINFNMEAQAQGAKCEDQPGNQGLGCTRHLLQCPKVTVLTWLLLDGARTLAHSLGNPGDLFKPGPKLGANRSRKRTGFPMSSQTLSGNQEALGLSGREEQEGQGGGRSWGGGQRVLHCGLGCPRLRYTQCFSDVSVSQPER